MATERITGQTLGTFLKEGTHRDDTKQAIERYIGEASRREPEDVRVEEIYAQTGGFPDKGFVVRLLTIVSDGFEPGKWKKLHDLESQLRAEFPLTQLNFRILSSDTLSPKEIEKFMDGYIPQSKRVYPYPQQNNPAIITP